MSSRGQPIGGGRPGWVLGGAKKTRTVKNQFVMKRSIEHRTWTGSSAFPCESGDEPSGSGAIELIR
jgi:hypothetical protein